MKIAHVEASNVVPPLTVPKLDENVPRKVAGKPTKGNLLENLPGENDSRLQKHFESLNLEGIESWEEQTQQSGRDLIMEYQYLFVMSLSVLGKISLVQHDLKLDDKTLFKEWY